MAIPLALHVLATIIWVGGMFFAVVALRPASTALDAPVRLRLWTGVLSRFFRWVVPAMAILLVTGFWMFFQGLRGTHVHLMMGAGIVMMMLALHLYYVPYKRLKRCVGTSNWPEAASHLNQIRLLININLGLGLAVSFIAAAGRYGFQ